MLGELQADVVVVLQTSFPYTADTPLLVAAETGNEAMLTVLLRHGAQIDLAPLGRLRPMLAAAVKRKRKVASMLLAHGADPTLSGLEPAVKDAVLLCLPELELWEYAHGSPEFESLSQLLEAVEDFPCDIILADETGETFGAEYVTWEWTPPQILSTASATGKADLRDEVVLVEDPRRPLPKSFSLRCMTVGQWIEELPKESNRLVAEDFLRYIASPSCYDGEIEGDSTWSTSFSNWSSLGNESETPIRVRINRNGLHIPLRDAIPEIGGSTKGAFAVIEWLCRALQQPGEGAGYITTSEYRLESFPAIYDGSFGLNQYSIRVKVILEKKALPELKHSCWKRLFGSCNVLRHPVEANHRLTITEQPASPKQPKAPPDGFGRGIEVSFDLMTCLAAVEFSLAIDGGVVFVGYETILVPTAISDDRDSVQFHLITHPEASYEYDESRGQLNPYTTDLSPRLRGRSMKTDWLRSRRCFLGWCAEAQINLGTRCLDARVGYSPRSRNASRSSVIEGYENMFQIGTSQGISALVGVHRNYRFTSHQRRFTPFGDYCKLLKDTAAEVATVYDTQERRFWLVPKLSLLLHMSHAYVLNSPDIPVDNIPFVEGHSDATELISILEPLSDQPTILNPSSTSAPLLIRQLLLGLNINLLLLPPPTKSLSRNHLLGFEYRDVITTPGRGSCMKPLPLPSIRHHLSLLTSTSAIITCANLGDAITPCPSSPSSPPSPRPPRPNPLCNILPRGQDLLAATIPCLSRLAHRLGEDLLVSSLPIQPKPNSSYPQPTPATYRPVRLSENGMWNVTGDPFEECPHDEKGGDTCWERRGLVQRFDAKPGRMLRKLVGAEGKGKRGAAARGEGGVIPRALPARGAVVFGS